MVNRGASLSASCCPELRLADATVLIVDDNPTNVLLLQRLLERSGIGRTVGITDPRETVTRFHALAPDLVMLDLHMPHLDGVAVLEALRTASPPDSFCPVLVLTADASLEAKQRALAAGAKDFVTKPFEQTEVLLRVKNLLETRALHLRLQRHNAALQEQVDHSAERERRQAQKDDERRQRVQRVLDEHHIAMAFQPIVNLETSRVAGLEALARFSAPPQRGPHEWFAEADASGLGSDLELLAVRSAVTRIDQLPGDTYLSVNVSPHTALDPRLAATIRFAADRLVLELTEHARVDQYAKLRDALAEPRRAGLRIAVDDAGSGYASLQHILRLRPDIIKLDIELIRGIDSDPAQRALTTALVAFARDIGAAVIAEGIETADELQALRHLHVGYGQGFYLGRPEPLPSRA